MGSSFIHLIRTDSNEFFLMADLNPVLFIKRLTQKIEGALLVKRRARCAGPLALGDASITLSL